MSSKQPGSHLQSSTRRQIFSLAATAAASLSLLLRANSAQAGRDEDYDEDYRNRRRWRDHDERRHHFYRPFGQNKHTSKTAHRCFFRGTRILTVKGETEIENISIGDRVVTAKGDRQAVKWIGRQRFKKAAGSSWQKDILPVRISRFALDEQAPRRDLYVSPGHALFLGGILIPASFLVNGKNIVQAMPDGAEDIEYFHIELETHEVILAEGVPAETLLVKAGREMFDNFVEYERLYGVDDRPTMRPFAPIASYNGGRSELKALLRRAAFPIVDMRDPVQVAFDRIAARSISNV
jgi:Hint domain